MFLPRRTVTFLQFTRKVFNAVSFGCEQHDEVIQQISSFINQPVDPDEEPREYMVWTPKGRDYIWELLLNEKRKYQENAKGR